VQGVPAALLEHNSLSNTRRMRLSGETNSETGQRHALDVLLKSVVLAYIITERPGGVIIPILALRFHAEFDLDISGSAIERAVRELVCDGWLRMQQGKVVPARSDWASLDRCRNPKWRSTITVPFWNFLTLNKSPPV
jgi:hypothetical protein